MKRLLVALSCCLASLALGSMTASAHCPDNPPTILSSIATTIGDQAVETPSIDTGALYCGSERQVPRTIPSGANTFRVRSSGDVAPTSGTLATASDSVDLTFTRVVAANGSASYESAPVRFDDLSESLTASVCIDDACKVAVFNTLV